MNIVCFAENNYETHQILCKALLSAGFVLNRYSKRQRKLKENRHETYKILDQSRVYHISSGEEVYFFDTRNIEQKYLQKKG